MKTIKEQVDELRKAGYRLPAAQMISAMICCACETRRPPPRRSCVEPRPTIVMTP